MKEIPFRSVIKTHFFFCQVLAYQLVNFFYTKLTESLFGLILITPFNNIVSSAFKHEWYCTLQRR
jgi:hypothetical protein